ncbi:serine hydrolase domain-containing protein [Saccharibacillus qingshengii]|uniref:serine hydrolase domain-containing protein n=1 Tax=Saccharibacillus qingshengii TaxID=1763540 RepID=UPI001554EA62|nr:serine hydrolase [Saccharibacillus qingshengii]
MMEPMKLPRSRPEALGIDPRGISAFLDAVAADKFDLRSFMLLRHGAVAAEGWWAPHAPEDRHALYSVSKSFTSTAVGLAVEEGRLTAEDKVADLLPELMPKEPHPNLLKMTVHDLLTMGTGQAKDPLESVRPVPEADWARAFLAAEVENVPGSQFSYSSGATYMLSVILQKITQQKVVDYLEPRLFAPLGIERKTWQESPQGVTAGGWVSNCPAKILPNSDSFICKKESGTGSGSSRKTGSAWRHRNVSRTATTRAAIGRAATATSSGSAVTAPTAPTEPSASSAWCCRSRMPSSY